MLLRLLSNPVVWSLLLTSAIVGPSGNSNSTAFAADEPATKPAAVECRRAAGKIKIDGRGDEEAWKGAQVIDKFSTHWARKQARTATRARLLWDDEFLYFFADMEDQDLYADVLKHDDETWLNDVFELFFKPTPAARGYYEFQVTPANTTMEMYLPSRGSGGYRRWARAHEFRWSTAVSLRGKLNALDETSAASEGWSAEGRIPWSDFAPSGGLPKANTEWRFALCRYDYSLRFETPDLTSTALLTVPDFHHYEDYGVLKFVGAEK